MRVPLDKAEPMCRHRGDRSIKKGGEDDNYNGSLCGTEVIVKGGEE